MKFMILLGLLATASAYKKQDKRGAFDHTYTGHSQNDFHPSSPKVITNTIPVPHPYPVEIEKNVPYPVRIPVDSPYPVHISKPYPVHIEKQVPYKVDKPVPYPVEVPYKVPVYHRIEVPVPKPYPVQVDRPYPVPVPQHYIVENKVPFYINSGSSYGAHDQYLGHQFNSYGHDFSSDISNHDLNQHFSHKHY